LFVTHAGDGNKFLYVVDQTGVIRTVRSNGTVVSRPFLDISDRVSLGGERGLLGLAFHPRYEHNRRLFIHYTDVDGNIVIAEYERTDSELVADPDSERALLEIDHALYDNHNGGALAFGPDGYLYIATGDGGGSNNLPLLTGQRLDTLLGKILRIDVDTPPSADLPYTIPPDNPFVSQGSARGEIYFYGLRNPWRFSFDRVTGDIWIADVGQNDVEEVNRVLNEDDGGLNFGWNTKEGDRCFFPPVGCDGSGLTDPLAVYDHSQGCSVIGGYVYRGLGSRSRRGIYIFGDYCSGRIWMLEAKGSTSKTPIELLDTEHLISSFGVDERGHIYLTDMSSGRVMLLEVKRAR
jgi:hypothetical protein